MTWTVSASGPRESVVRQVREQTNMALEYGQMTGEQADAVKAAVESMAGDTLHVSCYGHNAPTSNMGINITGNPLESGKASEPTMRGKVETAEQDAVVGTSDVSAQSAQ